MIKDEETYKKFGYYPNTISNMSSKELVCLCDYCNELYITTKKRINIGRKVVIKDACVKCKFKKREDVSIIRDGVKNSAQRPEVRKKISEKAEGFDEKRRDAMMRKYGVRYSMQIESAREKFKATLMNKYGVDNPTKNEEIKNRAITNAIKSKIKNSTINSFNGQTYPEIAKSLGISRSTFLSIAKTHGIEFASEYSKKQNNLELLMKNWLDSENIKYSYQYYFRDGGYYADFYLNDYNLVIETDGIYWHSELHKDKNYHLDKKNFYDKMGMDSLFFRENEVCNSFSAVKSIINRKLNRQLVVFDIDDKHISFGISNKEEADTFCIKNHIDVFNNHGDIAFFIYYNNEPVMLMQVNKTGDNSYDISRVCYKLNCFVLNGLGKLFSFFIDKYNPSIVVKNINLRYEDSFEFEKMGFKQNGDVFLDYQWVVKNPKWSNEKKVYSNLEFNDITGYDRGLVKIFDCGQKKFVWSN